jgi:hypothetical protein
MIVSKILPRPLRRRDWPEKVRTGGAFEALAIGLCRGALVDDERGWRQSQAACCASPCQSRAISTVPAQMASAASRLLMARHLAVSMESRRADMSRPLLGVVLLPPGLERDANQSSGFAGMGDGCWIFPNSTPFGVLTQGSSPGLWKQLTLRHAAGTATRYRRASRRPSFAQSSSCGGRRGSLRARGPLRGCHARLGHHCPVAM